MPMIAGQVTLNSKGEVLGATGLAGAIFACLYKPSVLAEIRKTFDDSLKSLPKGSSQDSFNAIRKGRDDTLLSVVRGWATMSNDLGQAIIGYLTSEATVSLVGVVATIETTASAGQLPDPVAPGAPLAPPAAPVALPVSGAAGSTVLHLL